MSHPESDGAAEMLEGGIRAMSTGALRMVETMQRRQQWAAHHHAEQLHHSTRQVRQQHRALAAVDDLAHTGTQARRRTAAVTDGALPPTAAPPTARQLFPHFAPEVAEAAVHDLVVHGDLPAYLQAHRHATEEAVRAARTPDPAELHRRAVELFTDAHHEADAAHHDRAETRELDKLRQHLATDDVAAALDAHNTAGDATDVGQFDPAVAAAEGHDTAAARERRATAVRGQGYDADTTASALLHDLSFGLPAATATGAPQSATGPSRARNRSRSRSHPQQLTR